jgi:putative transposase
MYYGKPCEFRESLHFKTNNGMLINADVNGALNILRKYIEGIPRAIQVARDNGCLDHPLRIRVV